MNGEYLGDGCYAEHDSLGVWLRAPRDEGVHSVYLEPEVFAALCAYWRRQFGGEDTAVRLPDPRDLRAARANLAASMRSTTQHSDMQRALAVALQLIDHYIKDRS